MKLKSILGCGIGVLAAGMALQADAAQAGEGPWLIRAGLHNVRPKSDNGTLENAGNAKVTIDSSTRPTFNIDYFFTPNVALDVLAAVPFKHDIALNGSYLASTKHLPPTVSLQYHFLPSAKISPFVGAGVNYTRFFGEQLGGTSNLALTSSWGVAVQGGVDYHLQDGWLVGADLRWMSISTDVYSSGSKLGTAKIDPLAFGLTVGKRF